jgi:hypothetical protein
MERSSTLFSPEALEILELILERSGIHGKGVNKKEFMRDYPKFQEPAEMLLGQQWLLKPVDDDRLRVSGFALPYLKSQIARVTYAAMREVFLFLRGHYDREFDSRLDIDSIPNDFDIPIKTLVTYLLDIPSVSTGRPANFLSEDSERWIIVDQAILRFESLDELIETMTKEQVVGDGIDDLNEEERPKFDSMEVEPQFKTYGRTRQFVDSIASKDRLGRAPFARYLAHQLQDIWDENISAFENDNSIDQEISRGKSFILNLYGKWGSGKTTFSDLLMESLRNGKSGRNWITVEFNAWKQQSVAPIWWPLLDTIIRGSLVRDSFVSSWLSKARYFWWRVSRTSKIFILAFLVSVLIIVLSINFPNSFGSYKELGTYIAGFLAIVGSLNSFITPLLLNSPRAAETFKKLERDPVQEIRDYFVNFVRELNQPVIVLIDDLDRCRPAYAVELLEQLHVVFSSPRVFFLVAADRHWLSESFNQSYNDMGKSVEETGRSIGYLFLEKIFQLSIGLPVVNPETRKGFLADLLRPADQAEPGAISDVGQQISTRFEQADSDAEIFKIERELLDEGVDPEDVSDQMMKVARSKAVHEQREHRLNSFFQWIMPNPRLMKLIVSAYGIYLYLFKDIVSEDSQYSYEDQIAIWTILAVTFPRIAEFLEENPDKLRLFMEENEEIAVPPDILSMAKSPMVKRIFRGDASRSIERIQISEKFLWDLSGRNT